LSNAIGTEQTDGGFSVKGFIVLSRIPFLSPGLAALVTGVSIALIEGHHPAVGLVMMALIGIVLIMLATYYFNEYFDYEGDIINKRFTKFSGGSRALPDNLVPRKIARIAGYGSVVALAVMALVYLVFYFKDYPLLLPLALFGAFCGVFYSTPPFQWAYQGIGEIMIGGCYGILALVSGYYLTSGELDLRMVLIGLPAALTIFGVIVGNEFPDYEADRAVNKKNLIVRFGLKDGSKIYLAAMLLTYPFMLSSILVGVSPFIALTGLPVLLFCSGAAMLTIKGGYADSDSQLKISALTLLANLTSSLMFIPAFYLQGP
jgi:1,4-dihydroxy-2-naphthoate octaprenyltransferase